MESGEELVWRNVGWPVLFWTWEFHCHWAGRSGKFAGNLMCKFRKEVRRKDRESVWGLTHTAAMTEITGWDLIKGERN